MNPDITRNLTLISLRRARQRERDLLLQLSRLARHRQVARADVQHYERVLSDLADKSLDNHDTRA